MEKAKKLVNFWENSKEEQYDQVFVFLEDCLINTKSGSRVPKNIADFMPDYNLWYALKFANPKEIIVLENIDLSRSPQSSWFDLKISFISEWLYEITGIRTNHGYSYHGDWKYLHGYLNDPCLLDIYLKTGKILFIDRNNHGEKKFIESKKILYTTKDEFISEYNKSPRVYEKKRP